MSKRKIVKLQIIKYKIYLAFNNFKNFKHEFTSTFPNRKFNKMHKLKKFKEITND